jgi:hypothetical protein
MRCADMALPMAQQAEDSSNAAQRNGPVNGRSATAAVPQQHHTAGQQREQSPVARPRPWPRYQLNGGAPADPYPAGPVLPPGQPGR